MLVYIRDSDKDKVICNVDEKDIAEHLQVNPLLELEVGRIARFQGLVIKFLLQILCSRPDLLQIDGHVVEFHLVTLQIRLKKEQGEKERKRKDKAEAHLYTVLKVVFLCFCFCFFSFPFSLFPFSFDA